MDCRNLRLGLRSSDKVMQTENDYDREVFNGDLGRVKRIDQTDSVLILVDRPPSFRSHATV